MKESLVSKDEIETLTQFESKVDQAKMRAVADDEVGPIWVETSPAICNYFNRRGLGKSCYFDYKGVKVCETGRSEELKTQLARQLGELVHGDSHVNQVEQTRPNVNSVR